MHFENSAAYITCKCKMTCPKYFTVIFWKFHVVINRSKYDEYFYQKIRKYNTSKPYMLTWRSLCFSENEQIPDKMDFVTFRSSLNFMNFRDIPFVILFEIFVRPSTIGYGWTYISARHGVQTKIRFYTLSKYKNLSNLIYQASMRSLV